MRKILFVVALAACQDTTVDNFINPPPGVPDTCAPIADLPGCDQGSISYTCSADRPDDVGSDAGKGDTAQLACSTGTAGANGATLFCCLPLSQYHSDCAPVAITGCGQTSVGLRCHATAPPDIDPSFACSAPTVNSDGTSDYCCNTADVPPECAVDATVTCSGLGVGYTCAGSATPADGDPTLTCGAGTNGSGGLGYCCQPAT
jgi:hypothetical protein|nr:hypothetical protein [Kofleriaceae bacterium]